MPKTESADTKEPKTPQAMARSAGGWSVQRTAEWFSCRSNTPHEQWLPS